MRTLGVVFVRYAPSRHEGAFAALERLLGRLERWRPLTVRVDNEREGNWTVRGAESLVDAGGDNSRFEFSGWTRGRAVLEAWSGACDCTLFVDDAFLAYRDRPDELLDSDVLDLLVREGAVGGLVDAPYREYPQLRLMDRPITHWVRTSFFAVPGSVSLGDLVTFRGVDVFCDERYRGRAFRSDAPMSPDLARFLERWLTGDWHRAIPLSPETWATFRNKVLSILNEQALTLRWQSAGVPIYDLRFLRALRARSGTPLAEIPRARLEPFAQSLFRQKQYAEPAMSRVLARLRSMGRRWRRLAPSV